MNDQPNVREALVLAIKAAAADDDEEDSVRVEWSVGSSVRLYIFPALAVDLAARLHRITHTHHTPSHLTLKMEQHSSIDLEVDGENDSFEASPFRGRCNTWPTLPPRVDQFGGGGGQDDLDGLELGGGLGLGFGLDNTSSANLSTIGETGSSLALNDNPVIPTTANSANLLHHDTSGLLDGSGGQAGGPKKNTSRRNAWGNMSYADLITQAIQSSPDKRLTLSQIYDWMVQNVPYFKDKGDSNSSAGWKVSADHCITYVLWVCLCACL